LQNVTPAKLAILPFYFCFLNRLQALCLQGLQRVLSFNLIYGNKVTPNYFGCRFILDNKKPRFSLSPKIQKRGCA
jgi:hypothetical protein